MRGFVIDTNVYIEATRHADARDALAVWQERASSRIFQHAVVVAELLVGARSEWEWKSGHERWASPYERVGRLIVPGQTEWRRATEIIARLRGRKQIPDGRVQPSFVNDCLLAASARRHGHQIITYNRRDFELIAQVEPAAAPLAPFP